MRWASHQFQPEKREELLEIVIAGLTHIYRYFEPYRRAMARRSASHHYAAAQKLAGTSHAHAVACENIRHCCLAGTPTRH